MQAVLYVQRESSAARISPRYSNFPIAVDQNHWPQVAFSSPGPQRQVFVDGVVSGPPATGLRRWGGLRAPSDWSTSMGWSPGSPATGLRRWGGVRGPQRLVFVDGVEEKATCEMLIRPHKLGNCSKIPIVNPLKRLTFSWDSLRGFPIRSLPNPGLPA